MEKKTDEQSWVLEKIIKTCVDIKKNWNAFVKQELQHANLNKEVQLLGNLLEPPTFHRSRSLEPN